MIERGNAWRRRKPNRAEAMRDMERYGFIAPFENGERRSRLDLVQAACETPFAFFLVEIAKILISWDLRSRDRFCGSQNPGNKELICKIFRNKDLGVKSSRECTPSRDQDTDFTALAVERPALSPAKSWK